jgi:glycosyltransferase involved in cell wall biosynthesis
MDVWVANGIARLSGAKFVFELHDLWPMSLIEIGGMSRYHPFVRICAVAERATYRKADLVVSILPEVSPHVTKMGLPAERLAVIPNGIEPPPEESPSDEGLPESIAAALDQADACQKYIVVYTGSHGMPNALDTLLDAASTLRDKPVLFILVGNGHERERLLKRVDAEKLSNVLMFPAVQKAQVPLLLKRAHLAYLGAPKQSLYRFGVSPNKMIDYMAAGLPILFAVEAGNNPVLDANCGISVAAEDPSALAGAVCSMMRLPREQLDMLGRNGQRYVSDHHLYNVLARRFLEAVDRVDCRE